MEGHLGEIGFTTPAGHQRESTVGRIFWRIRLQIMTKVKFLFGLLAWAAVAVLGFWCLAVYESRPGRAADPPTDWPDRSRLSRDAENPTLLMFLHPHCPCSRASLEELTALLSANSYGLRVFVIFCKPDGAREGWEKSSLWQQAAGIKGIDISWDDQDQERRRFSARTSGQVLLFDRQGHLTYSGGITGGRGQTGDNPGRWAVEAILRGQSPSSHSEPVFGCSLVDPE
jgi:hypothetical protein